MNPKFLIKLAKKEQEVYIPPRIVPPLAQVKAQQLNIPLPWLTQGSMTDVMNFVTNQLKQGKIDITKTASQEVPDIIGIASRIADMHRLPTITDYESRLLNVANTDYARGRGYQGSCDTIALLRSAKDPNVIKGPGENALSLNKSKNFSSGTISPGRYA